MTGLVLVAGKGKTLSWPVGIGKYRLTAADQCMYKSIKIIHQLLKQYNKPLTICPYLSHKYVFESSG
jgi:hypothetical protein